MSSAFARTVPMGFVALFLAACATDTRTDTSSRIAEITPEVTSPTTLGPSQPMSPTGTSDNPSAPRATEMPIQVANGSPHPDERAFAARQAPPAVSFSPPSSPSASARLAEVGPGSSNSTLDVSRPPAQPLGLQQVAHQPAMRPARSPVIERGPIKGWLTGFVARSITVFDANGGPQQRIDRSRIQLPADGLPFYATKGDLVLVDIADQELLLDTSEFHVRMAQKQVPQTCADFKFKGQAPARISPASMGHGECR